MSEPATQPLPAGVLVELPAAELVGAAPAAIRRWIDAAAAARIPEADGTLATAREIAEAAALHAMADNTRRAYRAGIRAWCDFCAAHGLGVLPAQPVDVASFLADQRVPAKPRPPVAMNTLKLRLAAIAYLHHAAGLPSPTDAACVTATLRGFRRMAVAQNEAPQQKLAARIELIREMVAAIGETPGELRDRALLLVGFAGAFRRAELARIECRHLELTEHGYRVTLPASKGDRSFDGVTIGIPYGTSELCPVRALRRWLAASQITDGPVFRRIWATARPRTAGDAWQPVLVVGEKPLDPGSIARIVKARGAAIGIEPDLLGGHSLKRGAMNTAKDRRVHPAQLKQLGRHKSYATLGAYLEEGDLFENNALAGVL